MKKVKKIAAFLISAVCAAFSAFAQVDFKNMTTDQIIELEKQAEQELFNRNPRIFNIGQTGPGGGTIFARKQDNYYECAILPGSATFAEAENKCKAYKGGGYNDWYLPSIDELGTIYNDNVRSKLSLKGTYWSSNTGESYIKDGMTYDFDNSLFPVNSASRSNSYGIILVRTFQAPLPPDTGKKLADGSVSYTINSKNIKLDGTANEFVKVADGDYTLKIRPDNQIVMNIKLEVIKTFVPEEYPEKHDSGRLTLELGADYKIYLCDEDGFNVVAKDYHLCSDLNNEGLFNILLKPAGTVQDIKLTRYKNTYWGLSDTDVTSVKKMNIASVEFKNFNIYHTYQ